MPLSPSLRSLANLSRAMHDVGDRLELEWSPDSPPDVFAAAALAEAFGADIQHMSADDIAAVSGRVEVLLQTGDESTTNAMATGFLESLLAQASNGVIDFQRIAWALGRESTKFCRAWDKFTGITTKGLWQADGNPVTDGM